MGNDGDSIFTLGDWAEDWYNRIHEEAVLEKAAKAGINVIYTHFFKGFGLETEYEEMENTRLLCERAAKYGIKVLGYCQLGSLYNETLADEIPNLEDLVIHDDSGHPVSWLGQYYRWSPCFNSREFIDYIKKVIRYGLEHVGLSGFHFDNSYNAACHCPKCTEAFRHYLTEHVKDPEKTMGLKHFRHVRIPREDTAPETHDTLYIWWLRYKADLCAAVHHELFSYVKEQSGGKAIVLHNPCFPRPGKTFARRGFEPSRMTHNCDFVFAENSVSYIRFENGRIKSMVDAFKFGQRFDYQVFDTCWTHDAAGKTRLPVNREEVVRFVAQSMIFTGLCGSPWTVRSLKDGHKNLLEDSPLAESLAEIFGYYHQNKALFNLPIEKYVKLLYVPDNALCMLDKGIDIIRDSIEELVTEAIPFSIITESDIDSLEKGQTVLVPRILYAEETLLEALRRAGGRGVKILVSGQLGRYYEDGKERGHSHWIFDLGESAGFYRTGEDFMPMLRELHKPHEIAVSESGLLLETRRTETGDLVLHVLNSDNERTLEQVTITLNGFTIQSAACISLEKTSLGAAEGHQLVLHKLQTTATLILKGERA
ncbi:MAG: beta-galactosidase [Clostridia bacterium]